MRKLALGVTALSIVLASVEPSAAIQNPIIQEVTFDDGNGNTNPLIKSLEMRAEDLTHFWHMNFVGTATRSDIDDGKYGRGALFDGDPNSRIAITDLNRPGADGPYNGPFRLLLWVNPTTAAGYIFRADNSFGVRLNDQGQVVIRNEAAVPPIVYTTTVSIPNGDFHHLWIEYDGENVTVQVDFGTRIPVNFGPMAPWGSDTQPGSGSMGSGFSGVLDELLVTNLSDVSELELLFDRKPNNCPNGLTCEEKYDSSLNVQPPNWPLTVPVRYKAVYLSTCTASNPCPLLMVVSGGGACGDDYSYRYEVEAYAKKGFFVVTVDPNCEYGRPWLQFPHETFQLIEAKKHVRLPANGLADRILPGEYYATGCSHGAQAVALWLLSEPTDFPKRAFARSANYAAHCTYHMVWSPPVPPKPFNGCDLVRRTLDQVTCGSCDDPSPHDHDGDQDECIEEQWGVINKVDQTIVQQRHLGAIWGRPDQNYSSCECPGGCVESVEGNDQGGRLMRDHWRAMELGSPRTGWFWEWGPSEPGCVHCPWDGLDGDVARCSACYLRYGYTDMQNQAGCENCLKFEGLAPVGECPEEWGMPGGGSELPCDEQAPVPGSCSQLGSVLPFERDVSSPK